MSKVAAGLISGLASAQPVQRAEWHGSELDVWIRANGQWLGRVRDKTGHVTWIPGTELRPI